MLQKIVISLLFTQQALTNRILLQTTATPVNTGSSPATSSQATILPNPSQTAATQTSTTTKAPETTAKYSTTAPETTTILAPLAEGLEYGSWRQACPVPLGTVQRECPLPGTSTGSDISGYTNCMENSDCCLCHSIICGSNEPPNPPQGCIKFAVGEYGAYGVQQIAILGDPQGLANGAIMECMGKYACAESNIFAASASGLICNDERSCADAVIQVDMPSPSFYVDCNGLESCKGTKLILNIGVPPPEGKICNPDLVGTQTYKFAGLKCNNREACAQMDITIRNQGCDKVIMETLDCTQREACAGASFQFLGDIDIDHCLCGPSCGFASGLGRCFRNIERFLCPDVQSCLGMTKSVYNPADMFYLECGGSFSCAQARFLIELTNDAPLPIRNLEALKFGGTSSGQEIVVEIDNQQTDAEGRPITVVIGRIECTGRNGCVGATFITGENVIIGGVVCGFESCLGCLIKTFPYEEGMPCNPVDLGPIVPVPPVATVEPPFVPAPTDPQVFVPAPTEPFVAQGPGNGQGNGQGNGLGNGNGQGPNVVNGPQNQFNGNPFV